MLNPHAWTQITDYTRRVCQAITRNNSDKYYHATMEYVTRSTRMIRTRDDIQPLVLACVVLARGSDTAYLSEVSGVQESVIRDRAQDIVAHLDGNLLVTPDADYTKQPPRPPTTRVFSEIRDADSQVIVDIGSQKDHTVDLVFNNDKVYARKTLEWEELIEELQYFSYVGHHPNLVRLEGYDLVGDYGALFFEACTGTIEKVPVIDKHKAMLEIALGVQHLHRHRILHGDIKAENVLMCDQVAKVGDLGLCERVSDNMSMLKYSLRYRPPEYTAAWVMATKTRGMYGQDVGLSGDIWALACVFYYILTGQELFTSNDNFELLIAQHRLVMLDDVYYEEAIKIIKCNSNMWSNNHIDRIPRGEYYHLLRTMLSPRFKMRPTIDEVVAYLQ